MIENYDAPKVESKVMEFWKKYNIYEKVKAKNNGKKKFYFLDGPPYTSGKVHLGTAWNKALKDCLLRYKRMQGFDVWDRAGYDMHGMPIEHAVEKKLGLKHKNEIPVYGVANFVNACKEFSVNNMLSMNNDFKRLGVWMDFDNAYQSIQSNFIEGVWWLVKKAHENGRLYEGEKTMHWCSACATSLAKHELEYESINDTSIFVKFPVKGKKNEFLIIWTTTPWTIPFNLGVMANPNINYVKAKVESESNENKSNENEIWIFAEVLEPVLFSLTQKKFLILEKLKGTSLFGLEYSHPFENDIPQFEDLKKNIKVHTVVMSEEYVNTDQGTGLVHMAPGCGPEDYEVGHKYGIPPFNTLTERGIFDDTIEIFKGFVAKKDDERIVDEIRTRGFVAHETKIQHDYAHCWRCKNPIVYRTTTQWFFKIEDLKESMRELNKNIKWIPDFAGTRNFDNWLANLRDNGITRQRYWGTPLPIWKCKQCNDFIVFGSIEELKNTDGRIGHVPEDLHKPWIDELKFNCKCGSVKERIPDVLDVWIDAGSTSWNSLDYPTKKDLFKKLYPADFILEGIDQIRGWFNLLFIASMVAMNNVPYKTVYMHGFINDAFGRKMSKSLGNYILPAEVIIDYGADTLRYYLIGGIDPGVDINYNLEDVKVKHRNLNVFWNLHKYVIELSKTLNINPINLDLEKYQLDIEELYIFSKLNSTIRKLTNVLDDYKLNESPLLVEELFLELSRTYLHLTRDKSSVGSEDDKRVVIYTVFKVLLESLKFFAPIAPFITELMYQNLRNEFKLKEESIHFFKWPEYEEKLIDKELETSMSIAGEVIQSCLALREKIQLGLRWPLKEIVVAVKDKNINAPIERLKSIIKKQVNVKEVSLIDSLPNIKLKIKADYSQMGPDFGDSAPKIIAHLLIDSPETVLKHIEEKGKYSIKIDNKTVNITKEHLIITREVPVPYEEIGFKYGFVYLNKETTEELEAEGFAREIMRRVQSFRKKSGLQKTDSISLFIKTDETLKEILKDWNLVIKEKVGASNFRVSELDPNKKHEFISKEKLKQKEFTIFMEKVE